MRLRPTALGWKGLLLLAAMQVAFLASNYNNLFFLLIAFSCVLGALGAIWSLANVRCAAVHRLVVPAAAADRTRPIELEVRTRGRPGVGLRFHLVLADDAGGTTAVDGGELAFVADAAVVTATLPPRPRGLAWIVAVRLTSSAPFGLFRARRDVPVDVELVTHPAPATCARAHGAGRGPRDLQLAAGSRAVAIAGLRPFRSGDSLRDVHWKASARRGQPIVREPEREHDRSLAVVLDRRCCAITFELALKTVTAWVLAAREPTTTMTLHSQDTSLVIRSDRASVLEALRWLAASRPLPAEAPPPSRVPHAIRLPAPADRGGSRG